MSWQDGSSASVESLDEALQANPGLIAHFRTFYTTLCRTHHVSDRLREICRLRIAAIHGCEAEWQLRNANVPLGESELTALERGQIDDFPNDERCALLLAECIPYNHHGLEDEQVAQVKSILGDDATVALLTSCAFFDVVCRWKLVLDVRPQPQATEDFPLVSDAVA